MTLDKVAGQRANVFVALAATGDTPANRRAGSAMNEPPPATALSAPPTRAARKSARLFTRRGRPQPAYGCTSSNRAPFGSSKNAYRRVPLGIDRGSTATLTCLPLSADAAASTLA